MMNASAVALPRQKPNLIRARKLLSTAAAGFLLLVACAWIQPGQAAAQTVNVGSASGAAGTAVDVSVGFTAGASGVATLQFDLAFPSSLTFVSTSDGSAATSAGKNVTGSAIAGGARVLVFGLNQNLIGSGTLAVVRLNIAPGTPPGTLTISVGNIVASDAQGNNVSASGNSGSATVTGSSDTTPPVISGVTSSGITQSGATISWTTNETSDSQVEYGTTNDYSNSTARNSSMVTSHSQGLSGLSTGTTYHYRVLSRDASGNLAASGDFTFTTTAAPDTTPPTISGIASSGITSSSATISWYTNEAADTQVDYGTTMAYGSSTTLNPSRITSHMQGLSGLSAGTTYHYRVMSRDAAGNLAASGDYTFSTIAAPDTTPPIISGVGSFNITSSSASITWSTNESADSQVEYGPTNDYGSATLIDPSMGTSHIQTLTGLSANTIYHYRILSRDAAGNRAVSGDFNFKTATTLDTTPPTIFSVASIGVTNTSAIITWTTDEASDSQADYGTTAAYGSSTPLNASMVTTHALSLTGLSPNTSYHYRVISKDASGNLATSGDLTFTTAAAPDTTPPIVSDIACFNLTSSGATIMWTTDEPSDSQAEYGTTTSYGSSTPLNASMVVGHSLILTGLSPSTTYHFRVMSKDASGNLAASADFSFTTKAASSTAPAISGVSVSNVTQSNATISWNTDKDSDSLVEYGTTTSYGSSTPRNASMVLAHTIDLSGLAAKTTYHFRIHSADADGNETASEDFTFTTNDSVDTTPPVISGVAATCNISTSATINWTTNEAADSQVEYGLTASYGSMTVLNSSGVTAHSEVLSGLTVETLYHYRVLSRDAAGNLSVSGDFTFTTIASDTTPPVITGVTSSNIGFSTAKITWITNEATDGQVEYGLTTAYGSSSPLKQTAVTSHAQILAGLKSKTLYHFRVMSRDASGNLAISGDYTFTTQESPFDINPVVTLFYPRLLVSPAGEPGSPAREFVGFGITNLDIQPARLRFTAYNAAGAQVTGDDVINPVVRDLLPGEQIPAVDSQLFGSGFYGPDTIGWVKIESTVSKVAGFFMMFNADLTEMDGANVSSDPLTSFILPEIEDQGFTKVTISNPNAELATVTFHLMKADGTVQTSITRDVPAGGSLAADLFTDIFPNFAPEAAGYVKVNSNRPVFPFELLGRQSQYIEALNAQDATQGASTLYCPQYATGANWRTSLSVVNLDEMPGTVTLRYFPDSDTQLGATKVVPIDAHGKIYIDDPAFFLSFIVEPGNMLRQGYIEIISSGVRLAGSVVFGDPERSTFSAALPLVSALQRSFLFSHIASDNQYFTGVAILNPKPFDATVRVDVYNSDGSLDLSASILVPRMGRISHMLTEIFPELGSQQRTSGYFVLTSDQEVASFALFGTRALSALSAIPPQVIK